MPLEKDLQPGRRWEFDDEVTNAFDEMLRRSIPEHDVMRRACFELACPFVAARTAVVDLGCSRGEALAPFVSRFGAGNRYVGVEVSRPMLAAARERFKGYVDCGVVEVREHDLRLGFPAVAPPPSVVLCVLTLQFVPIEHRARLLRQCCLATAPGGCLVLVEKVLGDSAELDQLLVDAYHRLKMDRGYSPDDVQRKRLSLEGVLVPVTAAWDEHMLRTAGYRGIECFWRHLNFAGWIAVKE
jgi:tRNA (cmo5U34)-methyltransferase